MSEPALLCQECRGYGRVTEDIIAGTPRREICGWCQGSGEVTPEVRGVWLRTQKEIRRVTHTGPWVEP